MQFQHRVDDELGTAKTSTSTPLININANYGTQYCSASTSADAGDTITFDALISGMRILTYVEYQEFRSCTFVGGNTGSGQVQVNAGTASGTSITVQSDAADDEASDSPKVPSYRWN